MSQFPFNCCNKRTPDELSPTQAERLKEIHATMCDLLNEAWHMVRTTRCADRAKAYWYGHMKTALSDDHEFIGDCPETMEKTVQALQVDTDEEEE